MTVLTPELVDAAGPLAAQWNCSPALHPDDHLMAHVLNYCPGGLSDFFKDGAKDAGQIKDIAARFGIARTAAALEFACGYGRLSRHLSPHFSDLTCADIHAGAVEFLRDRMGLNAIMSATSPKDFRPGRTFDFIFVVSLFSHLPDDLFGQWLARLYDLLNPGGVMMFTTHGETATQVQPLLEQKLDRNTGFGFLEMSDQADLDFSIYGSSTTLPHYVERKISAETRGRLVDFSPAAWWEMQDQWVIRKPVTITQRAARLVRTVGRLAFS